MDELTIYNSNKIIELKNTEDLPQPFEQDIYLYTTNVAGTSHIEGIEELVEYLNEGDTLTLLREPNNEYDEKAILVRTNDGVKLGYIPRYDNEVFANLMDAGKKLYVRIGHIDIDPFSERVFITIDIYMKD